MQRILMRTLPAMLLSLLLVGCANDAAREPTGGNPQPPVEAAVMVEDEVSARDARAEVAQERVDLQYAGRAKLASAHAPAPPIWRQPPAYPADRENYPQCPKS